MVDYLSTLFEHSLCAWTIALSTVCMYAVIAYLMVVNV